MLNFTFVYLNHINKDPEELNINMLICKSKLYIYKFPSRLLRVTKKRFTFVKSKQKAFFRPYKQLTMSMKDRIKQIMESQHMTQQTFASFIGMSAASLSSIFNNRTKPTLNTVEAIKSKIPNISTDWLMFGRGSMYEDGTSPEGTGNDSDVTTTDATSADSGNIAQDDLFGTVAPNEARPVSAPPSPVREPKTEIRYVERPQRQITEIRIFFDDGTYETFSPQGKQP